MQQSKQAGMMRILILLCFLLLPHMAQAVQPDELLKDAKLETRARAISAGLRCLVCQNQSIDDSDAPLARDLRILVRERLTAGDSDQAVLKFVVARYGQFILLKPPINLQTFLLWSLPALILLVAGGVLVVRTRNKRQISAEVAPLNADELANLRDILNKE